jgi:fumarylacetoacetase
MSFVIDPSVVSWVDYEADHPFPIQNLPFCTFCHPEFADEHRLPGVAIGDYIIDLHRLQQAGLLVGFGLNETDGLDPVLRGGRQAISALRQRLYELLHEDNEELQDNHDLQQESFFTTAQIELLLPTQPRAYVDFYSGIHHASNVGRMFRPDQPPLLPNYRWIPIGYNGRASSVVPSGYEIQRPLGITKVGENDPSYGPTKELDFELEMGFFVCGDTDMGQTLTVAEAEQLIAGVVIVNDWSARDVQRFEYQPLGPFLAKSFATSVSPFLVTLDALEPFRIAGMDQEPAPLPHLAHPGLPHLNVELEVRLRSAQMAEAQVICRSNMSNLYWSLAQQLAHQASNGTSLEVGDLYATGTISGEHEGSFGSMLELTWRGQKPIDLADGTTRTFLEDGDEVTMTAYAQGDGYRIGFGEVTGIIGAAQPPR